MIERIIAFSIRNRSLVILAGLALALWGVYAVYHTPADAIPDLSENQVIVFTDWMGHSPREIEDQVTYPLALHLQGLAGVRTVRSSSDCNFSTISVIFEDGVDPYFARQRVAEGLARAAGSLPPGVAPYLAADASATGQIFWYTVEGQGYDLGRLRAVQDWYVRSQLESVPGVAEVASVGGYAAEYQIEADPHRLQARGVTLGEVVQAVSRANIAVGGHVVEKGNAEYLVRGVAWVGQSAGDAGDFDAGRAVRDLENVVLPRRDGSLVRVGDVARVGLGPQPRRGVLEKDGSEVTGGVVLMRQGENPLEVTRRLRQKIQELQPGLPPGVRLVPFYDRTPLIEGAVATVTGTLVEAILTATVCVLLVLLHFRTSFVIALTLPLAVLGSFALLWTLRRLGIADVQTNVMSLVGLAISIGVLVDSSVVMAENVMHHLRERFGDRPVRGDVRELVLPACRTVGRPIFFSVVIMLLSFLPVFALGGIEGKMFRPLAFTKSFALLAVAALAITLVPALCTVFVKGRLRGEMQNPLVRGVILAYRPVLTYVLDHPAPLVWVLGATALVTSAALPLGRWVFLLALFVALTASAWSARTWKGRLAAVLTLVLVGLAADRLIQPLGADAMTPLDEGMTMDMPITVPRASVTESADDLKERDMVFCRFPEVDMVVGKAGRAETPSDPAPLDMIETMVNFRPSELWPKRKLRAADAERQSAAVLDALLRRGLAGLPEDGAGRDGLVHDTVTQALPVYDAQMREFAYQRNQEFTDELGPVLVRFTVAQAAALIAGNDSLARPLTPGDLALVAASADPALARHLAEEPAPEDVTALARQTARRLDELGLLRPGADPLRHRPNPLVGGALALHAALGGTRPTFFSRLHDAVRAEHRARWRRHVDRLNGELADRAPAVWTRLALEALLDRVTITNDRVAAAVRERKRWRSQAPAVPAHHSAGHHHMAPAVPQAVPDPMPELDAILDELTGPFARGLLLWPKDRADLAGFGGELDRVMQMPGWANVWTMPIQNRVDMLSTGVNTAVGVRVLGRRLEDVVRASEDIAAVLRHVPGAADVVADPVRGKGYLEVRVDYARAARLGVSAGDVTDLVETALGGKQVSATVEGRERHPIRVRYPRRYREDEDTVRDLLVPARGGAEQVPLAAVADVRVVEGPASIKSENGLPRNYVRLNVRGRGAVEFVAEARRAVAERVALPEGVYVEWTGQFEHDAQARTTLLVVVPLVIALIFLVLWWTYHDLADALLMLLAVPGALAGGVVFQYLFGYPFSVTVWVGYIACFGMATATGIIMLVYLREAVDRAGGLAHVSAEGLRQAVLDGAVHRLRPKLLTEGITVISLAPLLWATGTGAEVLRPMVVPVLGGILIADEVIDLLLPVLFYRVRRRRWRRLHGATEALAG